MCDSVVHDNYNHLILYAEDGHDCQKEETLDILHLLRGTVP